MKLMIVDDEPYILKGLSSIIRNLDTPFNSIMEALDGIEALEKMEDFKPDLLITDISMPEMDGFELIRQAREKDFCSKFIILTGYNEFEYAQKAIRFQVIDYLLKPISKKELFELLCRIAGEIAAE